MRAGADGPSGTRADRGRARGIPCAPVVHRPILSRGRIPFRLPRRHMNTSEITRMMTTLLSELVDGAPEGGAFMLNPGDAGLLRSLDSLTAEAASASSDGGATIAAHVDHLRYGLSLMNRWSGGENPFADADWSKSWETASVSQAEWRQLREGLTDEAHRWLAAVQKPREVMDIELNGMVGSIAHLAYHLGAIRQIDHTLRGPKATAHA